MAKKLKILVLGSRGFLGKSLVNYLSQNNYDVMCVQNTQYLSQRYKGVIYIDNKIFFSKISFDLFKQFKPNIIINSFGQIDIKKEKNICKTQHYDYLKIILKKIKKFDLFIQFGSSDEYSSSVKPKSENDTCNPESFYGYYKYKATKFLKKYARIYNKNIIVLRPFLIYGPGQKLPRLIPYLINCIDKKITIKIGSINSKLNFLYISDFISLIEVIIKSNFNGFNIYNIGNPKNNSINDIIENILKIKKMKRNEIKIVESNTISTSIPNLRNFKKDFLLDPKVNLDLGLKKIIKNKFNA